MISNLTTEFFSIGTLGGTVLQRHFGIISVVKSVC